MSQTYIFTKRLYDNEEGRNWSNTVDPAPPMVVFRAPDAGDALAPVYSSAGGEPTAGITSGTYVTAAGRVEVDGGGNPLLTSKQHATHMLSVKGGTPDAVITTDSLGVFSPLCGDVALSLEGTLDTAIAVLIDRPTITEGLDLDDGGADDDADATLHLRFQGSTGTWSKTVSYPTAGEKYHNNSLTEPGQPVPGLAGVTLAAKKVSQRQFDVMIRGRPSEFTHPLALIIYTNNSDKITPSGVQVLSSFTNENEVVVQREAQFGLVAATTVPFADRERLLLCLGADTLVPQPHGPARPLAELPWRTRILMQAPAGAPCGPDGAPLLTDTVAWVDCILLTTTSASKRHGVADLPVDDGAAVWLTGGHAVLVRNEHVAAAALPESKRYRRPGVHKPVGWPWPGAEWILARDLRAGASVRKSAGTVAVRWFHVAPLHPAWRWHGGVVLAGSRGMVVEPCRSHPLRLLIKDMQAPWWATPSFTMAPLGGPATAPLLAEALGTALDDILAPDGSLCADFKQWPVGEPPQLIWTAADGMVPGCAWPEAAAPPEALPGGLLPAGPGGPAPKGAKRPRAAQ